MKIKTSLVLFLVVFLSGCRTEIEAPIEKNNFMELTSNKELLNFSNEAAFNSSLISIDTLCLSVQGKVIPYLHISNNEIDSSEKVRVLIFAQQHGNEQAGKEGALLLLKAIANNKLNNLFDKVELILIPQMNPDGSDADKRRNGNDADLNRDHLILSQPETAALHKLFNKYQPQVTLDVHEYRPFGKSWIDYGYIKNFDIQFGTVTNPNISEEIFHIQKSEFLPFIKKYLNNAGYSFNEYIVGGPPEINRIRYSTVDINDGRQSFGIQHSLSFILEGKNGKDSKSNLKLRAESQFTALKGFLQFIFENSERIKKIANDAKDGLSNPGDKDSVAIRMERVPDGQILELELKSVATGNDTLIKVEKFHPETEDLLSVKKPFGYLVEKSDSTIVDFLNKHFVELSEFEPSPNFNIYAYKILAMNETVNEELENYFPDVEKEIISISNSADYHFIPTKQVTSNLLVTAFEPQSMLGLIQYDEIFPNREFKIFPVYRVEMKN